jgi:hypothetical protein
MLDELDRKMTERGDRVHLSWSREDRLILIDGAIFSGLANSVIAQLHQLDREDPKAARLR